MDDSKLTMDEDASGVFEGTLDAMSSVFQNYTRLSHTSDKVFEIHVAQRFGRFYALKSLSPKYREDAFFKECLAKEFQIGVQLDHPNIVRVNSIENDPVLGHCLVMDFIQGIQLDEWLATNPSKKLKKQVIEQIFSAITYCHGKQICHYDLKPSNILITENGTSVKIIDFGLADQDSYAILKHASGTRQYAAPEQLEGGKLDCLTDIYALGRILQLLFPKRFRRAKIAANAADPKKRPQSVEELRHLMQPNFWLLLSVTIIVGAFILFMTPMGIRHPVSLDSGQTVYFKVLSHWKREVELVPQLTTLEFYTTKPSGDLIIPSHIKYRFVNYRVKSIASNAFNSCEKLTHLTLPEGIEFIGYGAFVHCSGLKDTLVIPRSIRKLEGCAWANCYNLETVILKCDNPVYDNNSGDYTYKAIFPRCDNLRNVIVDSSVHNISWMFTNMNGLSYVSLPEGLTDLGNDIFAKSPKLECLKLPSTLKTIGWGAFYGSGLQSIVIPDNVETIEPYAFSFCDSLQSITIGKKITKISNYVFAEDKSLQEIILHCEQPPFVDEQSFENIPENITIKVPEGSVKQYQMNSQWKKLGNIIENK